MTFDWSVVPVTAAEKIADNCGFHPTAQIFSEDKRDGL
jgi:hypothetical protein